MIQSACCSLPEPKLRSKGISYWYGKLRAAVLIAPERVDQQRPKS